MDWKVVKTWDTDDALDDWLRRQGLNNSDAIVGKVALGTPVVFAKGTKRLRYAGGMFYMEQAEVEAAPLVGNKLDAQALKERWQKMEPNIHITVKLNKHLPCATKIDFHDRHNRSNMDITLNPNKMRTEKRINEEVKWVDEQITK